MSVGTIILIVLAVKFGLALIGIGIVAMVALFSSSMSQPNRGYGSGREVVRQGRGNALLQSSSISVPDRDDPAGAFKFDTRELSPAEVQSVQQFFSDLSANIRNQGGAGLTNHFDGERMFLELERVGGIKHMRPFDRTNQMNNYKELEFGNDWVTNWKRLDAKKACWLHGSNNEVAVLVSLQLTPNLEVHRQLWWLRSDGRSWRWYDFADLENNGPISIGILEEAPCKNPAAWVKHLRKFRTIIEHADDLEQVEKLCAELERLDLPAPYHMAVYLWQAHICLAQLKLDDAKDRLEKAKAIAPDFPQVLLMDMQFHRSKDETAEALTSANRFITLFGGDAELFHEIGQMHLVLKQNDDAVLAYRQGLQDDPASTMNLTALASAFHPDDNAKLTPEEDRELQQRMTTLTRASEHPTFVLDAFCYAKKDADILEALLKGYRRALPKATDGDYYAMRLKILREDTDAACAEFRDLIGGVADEPKRAEYLEGFLVAMASAGKALDGYKAAPDPKKAFRILADASFNYEDGADRNPEKSKLEPLLELHASRCPNDSWLLFVRGQILLSKKQYAEAETELKNGMNQPGLTPEDKNRYARSFAATAYQAGHGLEAYQQIEDKELAFGALSWRFRNAKDGGGLGRLIELHRKTGDENLALWEADLKFLEEHYAEAVQLLKANQQQLLKNPINQWRFRSLMIRSLAHDKKVDEALLELRKLEKGYQDRVLEAVVYALAGDVPGTEAVLERASKEGQALWMFHADEELGPILRSEAFKKVCEKYPDPREKK